MSNRAPLSWLAALALVGCSEAPLEDAADHAAAVAVTKNPLTEVEPVRPGDERVRGQVAEALRAGSYTYLSIASDDGTTRWVVTMKRGISPGARVEVTNMGTRRDFRSKKLGRTFDELVFGVVRPVSVSNKEGT